MVRLPAWLLRKVLIMNSDGPDAYDCKYSGAGCSVTNIMNKASFINGNGGPGGWNDLDMLEVGNGAMTDAEYVGHFSMCKRKLPRHSDSSILLQL